MAIKYYNSVSQFSPGSNKAANVIMAVSALPLVTFLILKLAIPQGNFTELGSMVYNTSAAAFFAALSAKILNRVK